MASTLIIAAVLLAVVGIGWRFSSRRTSIPCPSWLAFMVELENPLAPGQNAKHIVERLDVRPGMTVLDAGCGPGRVTIPLAQAVGPEGRVTALDIQAGMLARARERAEAAGITTITYLERPLGPGVLEAGQFDRAVLVTVLGEIPDRAAALREIHRALRPGGILSVTELIFDPHFQSRRTVALLGTEAGFREKAFAGNRCAYTLHLEKPVEQPGAPA